MEPIKQYLTENGLTVEALAEIVDIDKATIYRHLNGQKFKLTTARKYAEALGLPLERLLSQVA